MILSFTAIDKQAQIRDFSWWFSNLEFALDVLNSVSLKGQRIIKAELIDNGQHTQLSVDAFDGEWCSKPIQQLENDWRQLLHEPVRTQAAHT